MISVVAPVEIVSGVALFEGLTEDEVMAVAQAARMRHVPRHTFLFHQGDPADAIYVVLQGQVRLSQVTTNGQEVIIRFMGPGDLFGVIAALRKAVYPISVETVEDAEFLVWGKSVMMELMTRFPRLSINAMQSLTERVQEMQDRVRELQTERVERRIARTLLRLTRQVGQKVDQGVLIDLALTRQDLAEMTGTTLYTVSRVLSQWEQEGLVESGRERIVIRSPHRLVVIAEDLQTPDREIAPEGKQHKRSS